MNKKIIAIICGIILLIVIVVSIVLITKKDNPIIGKYELKELKSTKETYNKDTLKEQLGRIISIEITKDNLIKTTTYYSTDGRSRDTVEQLTYDNEKIYDPTSDNQAFYSYKFEDGILTINNLMVEETTIFEKQK